MDLNEMLAVALKSRASDIHLKAGLPPIYRIDGNLRPLPKAPRLTWEEAAAPTLVGTTAYRMLFGWQGNELREGDVVLVWGGSGGLGSMAIQMNPSPTTKAESTQPRARTIQVAQSRGRSSVRTSCSLQMIPPMVVPRSFHMRAP